MADADDLLLENFEQEDDLDDHELEDAEPLPAAEWPTVTADDAITLAHARSMSGRRGARLVLLMGEAQTGKTALAAMLWQHFLEQDGIAGHRLAGSRTALGLERRAHGARLEAQQRHARFPATRFEDGGVLHLRVRRPDGGRVELLLSDLPGEQFERVREGQPLLDEVPWAARADRFAVLVDAKTLSLPGGSEIAATRAQRLLLALHASHAVRDTARVGLVVTKADTLGEAGERALGRHEPALLELARELDPDATSIRTAAIARGGGDSHGLGAFVGWLCSDDRPRAPLPLAEAPPSRSIAAFRA